MASWPPSSSNFISVSISRTKLQPEALKPSSFLKFETAMPMFCDRLPSVMNVICASFLGLASAPSSPSLTTTFFPQAVRATQGQVVRGY